MKPHPEPPMTADNLTALPDDVLIAHAEGRVFHVNTGRCPDGINGPKSRTKGCPVCDALKAHAALLAARDAERVEAARYRWLRANVRWCPMPENTSGAVYLVATMVSAVYGNCDDQVDAAIDAALQADAARAEGER